MRDLDSASSSFGMQNIFETEKAVYCVTDRALPDGSMTSFMYFSDKEAHEWLPLCVRPDCMHNSESCSAMLEGNVNMKIWLYGSHIYYMLSSSQPVLWRMKLDGSGHEKLLAFKLPEDTEFSQYMWNWYFHGKYAIAELISVNGGDREDERDIRRYMIDLSADAPEQTPFDLKTEEGAYEERFFIWVGSGDILYAMGNEKDTLNTVLKINIASQKVKELCTLPEMPSRCWRLENGKLLIAGSSEAPGLYSIDTESGDYEVLFSAEQSTRLWRFMYNGYIFGSGIKADGGLLGTQICDSSGGVVAEIPYEAYDSDYEIIAVLGNYVFASDISGGAFKRLYETPPEWYLDIRDIGAGSLMWRRWEP